MNVVSTSKIKDEPGVEGPPAVIQYAVSSENIIKFFLDNEYKPEASEYHYNLVKCLDEVDGKFKYFSELNCNEFIDAAKDDYKNLCNECNKQFSNTLAVQNHCIYSHPSRSMFTTAEVHTRQPVFTLTNIKVQPQEGVRVVKKTDINFG